MGTASFSDFLKIDIRVGTIVEVTENAKANKPAYKLRIDFGAEGEKISSAQITDHYKPEDLKGKQIMAVINFPMKRIADVKSECLVLGVENEEGHIILVSPEEEVTNGKRLH
jgi:tRNA-binding protein